MGFDQMFTIRWSTVLRYEWGLVLMALKAMASVYQTAGVVGHEFGCIKVKLTHSYYVRFNGFVILMLNSS